MSTIIRTDQVIDGFDVSCQIADGIVVFHFDHNPSQAEINATITNYIASQTPVITVNLVAEDGTTV